MMQTPSRVACRVAVGLFLVAGATTPVGVFAAQQTREATRPSPPPMQIPPEVLEQMQTFARIDSPEVGPDRRVTFRILAPKASEVRVDGEWAQGFPPVPTPMTKGDKGVWSVTVGPLTPGAYRYAFVVDGAQVVDPKNTAVSETVNSVKSVVEVQGPDVDFYAVKDVPHGSVETVWYHSKSLGKLRRMHVYTPPGYGTSSGKYPVFYLLHGAGDGDDSWTSIGRANFILDNLLADGKMKPMIVVMPAGHTSSKFEWGNALNTNEFETDFQKDIRPFVESRYRVLDGQQNRAIAGLSMGGFQTLNLALPNLKDYAYVGVFSSGMLVPQMRESFEKEKAAMLDDADSKKGLKLVWFATGKDDFLIDATRTTVDLLKRHNFTVEFQETAGAHTWENWRFYLRDFAPRLFQ